MAGCCEEGCIRTVSNLLARAFRRRVYYDPGSLPSGPQPSAWQLLLSGLVPTLPLAFLVTPGLAVTDLAGPSAILGVLVAAVSALFSGICLAELRFRLARVHGDEYHYLYHTVGELPAFLIGWSYLLYHVVVTSVLARGASQGIDCLTGNKLLNLTLIHIGEIPAIESAPDFLSIGVVLLSVLLFRWFYGWQDLAQYVISSVVGLAVLFTFIVGLFHSDLENWTSGSGFFPFKANGICVAAIAMAITYEGIQPMLNSAHVTNSRGQVLLSWASILTVVTIVAFSMCSVISLLVRYNVLTTETPLQESFSLISMSWVSYVLSVVAVPICIISCMFSFARTLRLIIRLSSDGLIYAPKKKKVPTATLR